LQIEFHNIFLLLIYSTAQLRFGFQKLGKPAHKNRGCGFIFWNLLLSGAVAVLEVRLWYFCKNHGCIDTKQGWLPNKQEELHTWQEQLHTLHGLSLTLQR
jgi:hypothetical protein